MTKKNWISVLIQNVITLAIVIIGAIVTVSMSSNYSSEISIKDKIDGKLDRSEYVENRKEINIQIKTKVSKDVFESYLKNQDNNQKALIEIQKDIKTILKEMPK